MRVVEKYSHLNGEEFLIVHHKELYDEIKDIIEMVDADTFKTKISKEKTMKGRKLYNPDELNREFKKFFEERNWQVSRYKYCVTTDYPTIQKLVSLSYEEQKEYLKKSGIDRPITSYK